MRNDQQTVSVLHFLGSTRHRSVGLHIFVVGQLIRYAAIMILSTFNTEFEPSCETNLVTSSEKFLKVEKQKQKKFRPGTRWARRCWQPARPGATVCRETPKCSTPGFRVDRRSPARTLAGPRDCGRRGCTGSSWTGRSACRSRSASAAAAEHDGPRRAGRSSPTCRTLKVGRKHDSVLVHQGWLGNPNLVP